ncbi:MAG: hypothetical protein IPL52_11045 [Flavobacteriales bacterium]|nr:hypothetical protein [Flavobacteriales bacterium]
MFDLLRSSTKHHEQACECGSDRQRSAKDVVLLGRHKPAAHPRFALVDVLARFDFFLAPSGVVMPLCLTLVKAMFAGCYSHLTACA